MRQWASRTHQEKSPLKSSSLQREGEEEAETLVVSRQPNPTIPLDEFFPNRSIGFTPVDRHPMLSKGLECVPHSLFQTTSYQLPSRGESVFTKTGGLNRRTILSSKLLRVLQKM